MSAIEFRTSQYQFSHGKPPRGRGSWAFQAGAQILWSPSMTYAEAKKWAREQARALGVSVLEVLP